MKMEKHVRRVVAHVWGPTGSILLHILLLILLCRLIAVPKPPSVEQEFTVDVIDMPDDPPPPDRPPYINDIDHTDTSVEYQPVAPVFDPQPPVDVAHESITPIRNESPLVLPVPKVVFEPLSDTFGARSAVGIGQCLNQYAGEYGKITEPAVIRALKWLSDHQNPNGSWGSDRLTSKQDQKYAVGLTGLAVLTFLAHGETPQHGAFSASVKQGIQFLVGQQDVITGSFCPINNIEGNNDYAPYAHAIATYAISEAYGLTHISGLKRVMENAVYPIIHGQMPDGGWGYGYCSTIGTRRDLSVMGWQVQALKSAVIAGADIPELYATLSNAVRAVESMQMANGRFAYAAVGNTFSGGGTDSMTGVGVLCLQLLGYGKHAEARAGLRALKEVHCDWDGAAWGSGLHHTRTYDYYYITQAKFQEGKGTWRQWNKHIATELVRAQHEDGFWLGPESEDNIVHKVYNTTLAALTLQVYYRFLPTYKPIQPKEEISQSDEDDVRIEFI